MTELQWRHDDSPAWIVRQGQAPGWAYSAHAINNEQRMQK